MIPAAKNGSSTGCGLNDCPKVTVAAVSRFWAFDQAAQLARAGMLHRLITGYPRWAVRSEALAGHLVSLPQYAAWRQTAVCLERARGGCLAGCVRKGLHGAFARATARALGGAENVIIGLSSFMREVIHRAQTVGTLVVVDHGSLHEQTEREVLVEECERFGFRPFGNWQHLWMIERMQEEFEHADYIFCCSALAKKTMIRNGVPADRIVINRFGVDLSEFAPSPVAGDALRPFRIIMVGGMNPRKGLHYLLEAFEELPGRSELWLVGGPPRDSVIRHMVSQSVARTGRIQVCGSRPQAQLAELYRQCDVFVLPSLADGWGMVVNQAMACGLPVVVSDMTGAKEIVEEGVTGHVVPSRNVEALTCCLESLLKDRGRTRTMGMAAAQSVRRGMTWDAYGERMISWLRRTVQ